jgi:hypothetical protein
MSRGYMVYGMIILGLYGLATWRGWEPGSARRGIIPQSVRQSPGGYRSYNFWRGGK